MKYLSLLLLLSLSSCINFGSDNFIDPNLAGNWNWDKSTGGIAGITILSDSVEYTQRLEIEDTGEAYWYRDGELVQEYYVERGSFEEYDYNYVFTPVSNTEESSTAIIMVVERISRIEIELREDCTDCFTHYFIEEGAE